MCPLIYKGGGICSLVYVQEGGIGILVFKGGWMCCFEYKEVGLCGLIYKGGGICGLVYVQRRRDM
jgi:hypothetical protein